MLEFRLEQQKCFELQFLELKLERQKKSLNRSNIFDGSLMSQNTNYSRFFSYIFTELIGGTIAGAFVMALMSVGKKISASYAIICILTKGLLLIIITRADREVK